MLETRRRCILLRLTWCAQASRRYLSREELEMKDVENQMEMQLVESHMQVERIIGERYEDVMDEDTGHVKETRKFLVKVRLAMLMCVALGLLCVAAVGFIVK